MRNREVEQIAGELLTMLDAVSSVSGQPLKAMGMPGLPLTAPGTSGFPLTASGASGLPLTASGASGFPLAAPGASGLPLTVSGASGLPLTATGVSGLPLTATGVSGLPLTESDESVLPQLREEERMAYPAQRRQTADLLSMQHTAAPGTEPDGELPFDEPGRADGGISVGTEDAMERIDSFFRRDSRRYDSGFDID